MTKFHLISLGCAKNTVDSHAIASLLSRKGFTATTDAQSADAILVNTCGFIGAAREETLAVLQELADMKTHNQLLIAAGCMAQLFEQQIKNKIPEVDLVVGSQDWKTLPYQILNQIKPTGFNTQYDVPTVPRFAKQGASAYLEISQGCRRQCAYCSIPLIKGTLHSRSKQDILSDAQLLQKNAVNEIMVIGQDTSDYGNDLQVDYGLTDLLIDLLHTTPKVPWIRLLYSFPGVITDHFIELMKTNSRFLNYLDIPLQHAHPEVLRSMNRPANINRTKENLVRLREEIPDIALRTTFIVGYPTEGDQEFQALLDFIKEIQFDRVGVFPFSFEENTPSAPLGDPVPQRIKVERVDALMQLQQNISLSLNQNLVGSQLDVLIEGVDTTEQISIGRSYRDAPEIDGLVFVTGIFEVGTFVTVKVTDALEYDLVAEPLNEN